MKGDPGPGGGGRRGGPEGLGAYLRFLHLGTQMAILLVLGVFGGLWLDGRMGSSPTFTVIGAVGGIAVGMAVVIRAVGGKGS